MRFYESWMGFGETDPDCWSNWLRNAIWESSKGLPFTVRWDMGMFNGTDAWLEFGMAAFLMAQVSQLCTYAAPPHVVGDVHCASRVTTVILERPQTGTTKTGRTTDSTTGTSAAPSALPTKRGFTPGAETSSGARWVSTSRHARPTSAGASFQLNKRKKPSALEIPKARLLPLCIGQKGFRGSPRAHTCVLARLKFHSLRFASQE